MTSAALAVLPACGLPALRPTRTEEAGGYGIPQRALDRLSRIAPQGHAVWQEGRWIAGRGGDPVFPVLSITKAVAALAAARAVSRGWIDTDEPIRFPEWRSSARDRRDLTLRHLLNSTSGLAPGDRELYSARPADKGHAALALPLLRNPGSTFHYGPASWEVLAEFLKSRLPEHGTSLQRWLEETVGELGIRPRDWRRDGTGIPYFSTGIVCTLSDLGRLGLVLAALASGRNQAGISAAIYQNLTAPRSANPMFSAGIWWNRLARMPGARTIEPERSLAGEMPPGFWRSACLLPAARAEWLALVGSGGSRVYVLPSAEVVVAIARGGSRWSDAAMLRALSGA
jgi:CubicO group peptidase (beta-lactamase class C family)